MRSLISLFFFGLISTFCFSQEQDTPPVNFVPNPSFEVVKKPRCRWVQSKRGFDRSLSDWTSPTETHPDIFNTTVETKCWAHPEKQSKGVQLPHSGNVMIGLSTMGRGGKPQNHVNWHEYIQVRLTETLQPGEKYYTEMWVLLADVATKASDNLGMWFSDTLVNTRDRMPICTTPNIRASEILITKKNNWVKVSGVFEATSEAQYLVIGNFYLETQTTQKVIHDGVKGSYYHIDDVLVRPALANEKITEKPMESTCPILKKVGNKSQTEKDDLTEIKFVKDQVIKLSHVYFEVDKADLLKESVVELDKLVHTLYNYPFMEVEISGHTDNTGSDTHNQELSEARAKAVVDYLIENDIKADRITYRGYGSSRPIADNDTDEGRQQNRRVEMTITKL